MVVLNLLSPPKLFSPALTLMRYLPARSPLFVGPGARCLQAGESSGLTDCMDAKGQAAAEILKRSRGEGFQAFLVGGCVRDLVMGLVPKRGSAGRPAAAIQIQDLKFKKKQGGKSLLKRQEFTTLQCRDRIPHSAGTI